MDELPGPSQETNVRLNLLRDIAVFQAKLIVDGLRDLMLVPASLIAGIMSLASGSDGKPGTHQVQRVGDRHRRRTGSCPCQEALSRR